MKVLVIIGELQKALIYKFTLIKTQKGGCQ